ncbi:MAG: T9SS type A sorting domain-containing protein [Saprospiraceae bacterium]
MKIFLLSLLFGSAVDLAYMLNAQTIYKEDWANSGLKNQVGDSGMIANIIYYGADSTGNLYSDEAIVKIFKEFEGIPVVIFFPGGRYLFKSTISLNRSRCILRGSGAENTRLIFDLSGSSRHCIQLLGKSIDKDSSTVDASLWRKENYLKIISPRLFKKDDWIKIGFDDSLYMFSSWAYGSLAEIMQIESIVADRAYIKANPRFRFDGIKQLRISRMEPVKFCGIECLSIERKDATTSQTSNIDMNYVVDSWVKGVESKQCNFAHIAMSNCAHTEIKGNYLHHAFGYGGGGMGYGIALQFSSSQCRVEDNIFEHLRHPLLLQAGSNGNVISFNFMTDPYWTGEITPTNSAGDIVLHGNFPFANLFESNINQNVVIDNSHGFNGPYNTFFRNRTELYGFVVSSPVCIDSLNIIMNDVTNQTYGFYLLQGNGHYQSANRIKNVLTPSGTVPWKEASLYLDNDRLECIDHNELWPVIGNPRPYDSGIIPALQRFSQKKYTVCSCKELTSDATSDQKDFIVVYPNPVKDCVFIKSKEIIKHLELLDITGKPLIRTSDNFIDLNKVSTGTYFVKIICSTKTGVSKIQKI